MQRKLLFTHVDANSYACLEDKDGNTVSLPHKWMPENAHPGAVLYAVCVANDEVSSLYIEIDLDTPEWRKGGELSEAELKQLLEL